MRSKLLFAATLPVALVLVDAAALMSGQPGWQAHRSGSPGGKRHQCAGH